MERTGFSSCEEEGKWTRHEFALNQPRFCSAQDSSVSLAREEGLHQPLLLPCKVHLHGAQSDGKHHWLVRAS